MSFLECRLTAARLVGRRARRAARAILAGCLASGLAVTVTQVTSGQDLPRAVPGVPMVIPVTDDRLLHPEPESWLMYRRTYDGWGFSPLSQIDTSNVADLAPAWTFTTGANDGVPQAPPIVNGRMMFVTTAEQVIALDAQTGTLLWRYRHPLPADVRRPHATNRGVALYGDRVYVGTLDARVVALDAATGQVVWKRAIANYRRTYYITMAPLVVNGMVMVGTSGGEHGVRGFIVALDAADGDEIWRRYTVPAPGEPGGETWPGDSWQTGGGPVWITGNYDPALGITYWGVGNGGPWTGDARPGDNLYTNSTIALDAATGELLDHHQYHWNGSWDWDEANAPLLVDIERGGRTIPALVHPGRNGYLWLLDRSGGGMRFVDAQPFVHQNVFTSVDPFTGRPEYDSDRKPGIGKRAEFCPSYAGGRDWRPDAFSPRTRLLYVPAVNNLCSTMEGRAVQYRPGRPYTGASANVYRRDGADHVGELQAWDLDTGARVWINELPARAGSVLATAGDLVFLTDSDGGLRAFDALSGEPLWRYAVQGYLVRSVVSSYAVDGVQYVALQLQPHGGASDAGNMVVAFTIDCQC